MSTAEYPATWSWKDPTTQVLLGKRRAVEQCFPRAHFTLYADVRFTHDARPRG